MQCGKNVALKCKNSAKPHECEQESRNGACMATTVNHIVQDAQLSQRDRAAGYISFGQKWKTGTGRQYFTDIIGLSSTTVI